MSNISTNVAVTGANGFVGKNVRKFLRFLPTKPLAPVTTIPLDMLDMKKITQQLILRISLVIHCGCTRKAPRQAENWVYNWY